LIVPGLVVKRYYRGLPKGQQPCTLFSGLSPDCKYKIFEHNVDTMIRTITERAEYVPDKINGGFTKTPTVDPVKFNKAMKPFKRAIARHIRFSTRMDALKYVSYYKGPKYQMYERARVSLLEEGLVEKDYRVSFFLKTELYAKDTANRLISPMSARYNLELGRYIKVIEKQLYKDIDKVFGGKTVFKSMNPLETGIAIKEMFDEFNDPVARSGDAVRFDVHVHKYALKHEFSVYKRYFPNDTYLDFLLKKQIKYKGHAYFHDGKITYDKEGNRISGAVNTASGNVLLMCSMIYNLWTHICTKYNRPDFKLRLGDAGDDFFIVCERKDGWMIDETIETYLYELGFTVTMETPIDIIEQLEFCQTHPVWTPEGYLMVRIPQKAIAKDSISVKPLINEKNARSWAQCVGQGGLSLTGGIPVWQEFYKTMERYGKGAKCWKDGKNMQTGLFWMARNMNRKERDVHPETRISFHKAFNIPVHWQLSIEEFYKSFNIGVDTNLNRYTPIFG